MKKHLSLFTMILFAISVGAQTIPNGDFENWTNGNPDSWVTYNDLAPLMGITPAPVTQESPAPNGNSYLKAVARVGALSGNLPGIAFLGDANLLTGTGSIGIPFTQTPAYFSGTFKHEVVTPTDSMLIVCQLTKWDAVNNTQILVGQAVVFNFGISVSNWNNFSSQIVYQTSDTPDTLSVAIASIGGDGAAVSVDHLAFGATANSVSEINSSESAIALFPNPANDRAFLNLKGIEEQLSQGVKIEVIDLTGRIVETHLSVRNPLFELNTSNLESGKYLIRISNATLTICKSLVKQ